MTQLNKKTKFTTELLAGIPKHSKIQLWFFDGSFIAGEFRGVEENASYSYTSRYWIYIWVAGDRWVVDSHNVTHVKALQLVAVKEKTWDGVTFVLRACGNNCPTLLVNNTEVYIGEIAALGRVLGVFHYDDDDSYVDDFRTLNARKLEFLSGNFLKCGCVELSFDDAKAAIEWI